MPDMLAHYLVAEAAARQSEDGAGRLVDRAFDAYKVGAQGPDVFFYSHVLRPRRQAGLASLTHQRHIAEAFRSMLEHASALPAAQREVAFAFIAGYAAHRCLDAEAHPWVMYWTGDITGNAGPDETARAFRRHGTLEGSIDVHLRSQRSARTDWLRKQRLLHLPRAQSAIVAPLLSQMLHEVYGVVFTPAEGRAAFRAMEGIYTTMSDPHAAATRLLAAVAPLSRRGAVVRSQIYPVDPSPTAVRLFAGARRWYNPWVPEVPRTETFTELTEAAVAGTARCLGAIAAVAEGDAAVPEAVDVIGDRSMFTGLDCEARRAAAVFAPDLDLLWGDPEE